MCGSCSVHCAAWDDVCEGCGASKGEDSVDLVPMEMEVDAATSKEASFLEFELTKKAGELAKDWHCGSCNAKCFGSTSVCYICSAPKPENPKLVEKTVAQVREGDWECQGCFKKNFAFRGFCFNCTAAKVEGSEYDTDGVPPVLSVNKNDLVYESGGAVPPQKEGDWACPNCATVSFAYRKECFACGATVRYFYFGKGYEYNVLLVKMSPTNIQLQKPVQLDSQGNEIVKKHPAGLGSSARPGDWACGKCNAHNFANRSSCFSCDAVKEETAVTAEAKPLSGGGNLSDNDWTCKECSSVVFGRNFRCFQCGK